MRVFCIHMNTHELWWPFYVWIFSYFVYCLSEITSFASEAVMSYFVYGPTFSCQELWKNIFAGYFWKWIINPRRKIPLFTVLDIHIGSVFLPSNRIHITILIIRSNLIKFDRAIVKSIPCERPIGYKYDRMTSLYAKCASVLCLNLNAELCYTPADSDCINSVAYM